MALYQLARKHCGQQAQWKASIEILLKKSGSKSSDKEFRRAVRNLAASDHLPDYHVTFDATDDTFQNRGTMKLASAQAESWKGSLDGDARNFAPG